MTLLLFHSEVLTLAYSEVGDAPPMGRGHGSIHGCTAGGLLLSLTGTLSPSLKWGDDGPGLTYVEL